ncbi:MAG: recombinase family protein [Pleurocapsa sp. MO_226.B13]|nr:recombinase family protein [Pleurocapsa sp. MO_226.B13]
MMPIMARDLTKLKNAIATIKQNSTQERYLDIGYTRVSSELSSQDTSIQRQIEDFTDVGCNLIIVERESGASAEKRSLYQAIIQEILDGTVIRVAATINSRLNRNQTESEYFYRLCQIQEVKINILDEPELNSNSLSAQKIRREKAFYAEMESKVMGFRQKKANIRAEKNLKAIARKPIFGYRFTPERKYEVIGHKLSLNSSCQEGLRIWLKEEIG